MRKIVDDYHSAHAVASVEAFSYGVKVRGEEEGFEGQLPLNGLWSSALATMEKGKVARETLLRTAAEIRANTGWDDPVESMSVHAYIAKTQYEASVEEKRRREEEVSGEGLSLKRLARERIRPDTPLPPDHVMEEAGPSRSKERAKGG
ncbi:hypothetical protein Mapa_005292 [Marchantia paleacea]|nr:hypothetical protein Mapa_005292 [Marchantia paleacea]